MLAVLATTFLLLCQSSPEAWRRALDAGEYKAAASLAEEEPEGLARYSARSEILYRAGDPSGALKAAEAGLHIEPTCLPLLYRATGAAIWLEESTEATQYSTRLMQAVDSASPTLPREQQEIWRTRALEFLELSRGLVLRSEEMTRSLERVRAISLGGLSAVLLVVAWACLSRYGRSSRPVS